MITNQSSIIDGVTVFADDSDDTQFYYLPREPRIARFPDGKPMFSYYRYQFALERPGDDGEPGGGYLVFTTNMKEDPNLLKNTIVPELRNRWRQEHPLSTAVPEIKLAPVDFTEGVVRMIIMRNDRFVDAIELGRPSLFGDNTASVAIELTSDGATLFHGALSQGGSIAAIEYQLRFPVRLPAVTINAHVNSKEVKEAVMTYTESQIKNEDTWGNEETRTKAHRTSVSEVMNSQGLIRLSIDYGESEDKLSQDDKDALQAFAFRAVDQFIEKHFLKGGTIATEADRTSQWMTFIGEDVKANFDMSLTLRDVIVREYNPSAQIGTAFIGVPLDQVVMDIDLGNAPWYFNTLEVTVDTSLDFAAYGDIVHSVVGHLSYDQPRPDGTRLTKRESVRFTADDRRPKTFQTRIAEVGRDRYDVEIEVNYKAGPVRQVIIDRFDTHVRDLTLNVPNPGVVEVTFAAAPESFTRGLAAIEVEVAYGDPRRNVQRTVETVILDAAKPEKKYRRVIYAAWDQPYSYRSTYVIQRDDGAIQRSTSPWMEASSDTRHVRISTPFDESFTLAVIPSVDWNDVSEMIVDLAYHDVANDYRVQESLAFSRDVPTTKRWEFPLRDPDHRGYRHRMTIIRTNGAVEVGDWRSAETDGSLVVGDAPGGVVTLEVDPADADVGGDVTRVLVNLTYVDEVNGVRDTEALLFRDAVPQRWSVGRHDPDHDAYRYDVTYFMRDGSRRNRRDAEGNFGGAHDFLFVPPPPDAE